MPADGPVYVPGMQHHPPRPNEFVARIGLHDPKPEQVWATNAKWPYVNDWSYRVRTPGLDAVYSAEEEKRARETQAAKDALRGARNAKHEFFAAILNKDLEQVQAYRKRYPSLLERHTPYGATPLVVAAAANDPRIVACLLEAGSDVLAGDGIGATPLIMAASKGGNEVIELLLNSKKGGNAGRAYLLAQVTKGGETAVMAAAKGGHTDTLKALIRHNAPHTTRTRQGASALMLACKHGRVECAKVLMEAGLHCTDVDPGGQTPLMYAAGAGAVQAVQMLLTLPGTTLEAISQPDMAGLSALEHACQGGHVACAEALVGKGAKLDPNSPEANNIFTLTAKAGHADMLSWLLARGVGNQLLLEPGSHNPMFAAVSSGAISAVDVLLAAGGRLEIQDKRGRTPLGYAAAMGYTSMVKLLVARGANMLATDINGRVPRQIAQHKNQRGTAQLLSDLAKGQLLVADTVSEKEAPEVGALVPPAVSGLWKPHRIPIGDPTRVSTYQLV